MGKPLVCREGGRARKVIGECLGEINTGRSSSKRGDRRRACGRDG
jgi:hypothetical protein